MKLCMGAYRRSSSGHRSLYELSRGYGLIFLVRIIPKHLEGTWKTEGFYVIEWRTCAFAAYEYDFGD
jgi:hypothetical protein